MPAEALALCWWAVGAIAQHGPVAAHPQAVHIRDSKDPDGPALTVSPAAWTRFVAFAAGADLTA
ncbi:DUF397 domain-containing protein [Streptomyces sp. SID13666]|nr:DUF397 domain-containing protein [Streptomyces sp. SID13666]NEA76327.1 DUF397 domain-containing protein [Streptomyces sp. SID13588]